MSVSVEEKNKAHSDYTEHIHSEVYKSKLREKFMECMDSGLDMSVDCDGNVMLVETKLVYHSFVWNPHSNSFEKAYGCRARSKRLDGEHADDSMVSYDDEYSQGFSNGSLSGLRSEELEKEGEV